MRPLADIRASDALFDAEDGAADREQLLALVDELAEAFSRIITRTKDITISAAAQDAHRIAVAAFAKVRGTEQERP